MNLILTDIDDTVLKFGDKFQDWCEAKGLPTFGRLRDLCTIETFLNCDRDRATELVIEFSTCRDTMPYLEPEEDALEVLPKLYAEGFRFVAISACVDTPEVADMRLENLERSFGFPWEVIHCVGLLKPKVQTLMQYDSTVWVEDNVWHAHTGAGIGHQTFLLDRPYNRFVPDGVTAEIKPKRVQCWREIHKAITA
jgi:hypothetical protein